MVCVRVSPIEMRPCRTSTAQVLAHAQTSAQVQVFNMHLQNSELAWEVESTAISIVAVSPNQRTAPGIQKNITTDIAFF